MTEPMASLPARRAFPAALPARNARPKRRFALVSILSSMMAFVAASVLAQPAETPAQTGVFGRWLTQTGNLEVEVARCGEALCGTVVKVLANHSMSGPGEMVPKDDRPALGMTILKNFVASGEGEWQGEIYSREEAKTYSCKISLHTQDQLVVRPYVVLPLIGKTLIWTRAASEAERK